MSTLQTDVTVEEVTIRWEPDESPDLSWIGEYSNTPKEGAIETGRSGRYYKYFNPANPEYGQQEFELMEKYERGDICSMGCWAEAEVSHPIEPKGHRRLETLSSAGLWGIESDSDKASLKEVEE